MIENFKISNWPYFSKEEIDIAKRVLKSGLVNYWTGNETKLFENEFAHHCNTSHAIALANGSLALSSAYLSLDLKKGDEIITTPRTFIASASSAVLLGLKPIFADVDINSGLISEKTIEPLITKKTKAICIVHLGGWPADMPKICKLAENYKLKIIEDCSQAHGASIYDEEYKNFRSVGSFGDIGSWSFCQDKIISTGGEGGMITTNKEEIMMKIWSFKDHGKSKKLVESNTNSSSFKFVHNDFGSNFRLTELQSAIGRLQLKKLGEWQKIRTRNALILYEKLKHNNLIRMPLPPSNLKHAWYKFNCFLNEKYLKSDWNRERIIYEIRLKQFPAFSGGCSEIYLEECFKKANIYPESRCINAQILGKTNLMFLIHPTITEDQMINYAEAIYEVINRASK